MKEMRCLLIPLLFSLCACHSQQAHITRRGDIQQFEQLINAQKGSEEHISPDICFRAIKAMLEATREESIVTEEETIDLYVLYGTDYWQGSIKTFDIVFAHQLVQASDSTLYEYGINLSYDPTDFQEIVEFQMNYRDGPDDMDYFSRKVRESIGFQKATAISPKRIEIWKEEI